MRVLITGGAGFIGSHLCDSLVAAGNEVSILDNLSTGSERNIAHLKGKIQVNQGDIRDKELVEKLTKDADLILHMAAALGVDNILENPFMERIQNHNFLKLMTGLSVHHKSLDGLIQMPRHWRKRLLIFFF